VAADNNENNYNTTMQSASLAPMMMVLIDYLRAVKSDSTKSITMSVVAIDPPEADSDMY